MKNNIEILLREAFEDNSTNKSFKELFDDKLKSLNISKSQAYRALGLDKNSIEPILDGTAKQIDTVKLLAISEFLDIDVNKALKIILKDEKQDKIAYLDGVRRSKFILENFDLALLKKLGFIDNTYDFVHIEDRIVKFFGLDSIFDFWDEKIHQTAFSRSQVSASEKMRAFWVMTSYAQFEEINNPFEYDRKRLVDLIPKIRPYTRDVKNGFLTVCKALYHAGVTVIFQRKIPNVQVRGATFFVNKKPCIVVTDLFDRYSTIWFSLIHELYHVLYHMDDISIRTYHLSGDTELWLDNEADADEFAREYLCSAEKMRYISPIINNEYLVRQNATQWKIHPSIIYMFYCYDNPDSWAFFQKYNPGVKESVKGVNAFPFDKKSVTETINQIKNNLELI